VTTAASYFETLGSAELKADTRKADFLALAETRVDETVFGDLYTQAVALMALHMMKLSAVTDAAADAAHRGVNSTSAEGLSISFGSLPTGASDTATWLMKTQYGQQYLALKRGRPSLYAQIVPVRSGPARGYRRWSGR
jgi:hypothetical protein